MTCSSSCRKRMNPLQPLYGAPEPVRGDVYVALRRVEVLVAEELLDLAQVRTRVQELGRKHVPKCVRGDALALADAGSGDVAAKDLAQLCLVQAAALDADEDRPLWVVRADRHVVDEQRHERGVDRDDALPTALRLPHPQQPPFEVDVVPVEPQQLAPP